MRNILGSLRLFWKSVSAVIAIFGVLYGIATTPQKAAHLLETYPWIESLLTPWSPAVLLGIALAGYVFWVDLRRFLEISKWLSLDDAMRTFRDNIPNDSGVSRFIDFAESEGDRRSMFLAYMRDGINRESVVARGIPDNGLGARRVPAPVVDNVRTADATDHVTGSDDRRYRNLEFTRQSIVRYAKWLHDGKSLGGKPNQRTGNHG